MDQFEGQNQQPENNVQPQHTGNKAWAVLGAFLPLVGLILFLVWKNDRPADAKYAGIGALIGVIVNVVISIISFVIGLVGGLAAGLSSVGMSTITLL